MNNKKYKEAKSEKRILITGATGFIGSHIAEYFCNKDINVTCLVRKNSNINFLKELPVSFVCGDITNIEEVRKALQGIGFVIHTAAMVKDWGNYIDFYNTNVEGTINILKGCYEKNIQNVIITGSNSSYGEEDSTEVKTEEFPFNSHYRYFLDSVFPCKMNYYRDTKALCTQKAVKFASENKMNVTILEPVWVYGEREFNTGFYEYMKIAKSKISAMPGSKKNKFHVVYAGDLARAYYLAYKEKLKGVNRIIIGNKKCGSMTNIYSLFSKELGVTRPVYLPKFVTYSIGFLLELIYTVSKMKHPPLLTRARVNMFYDNIEYSTGKAEKLLSFTNEYSLEEGIKRTVKWYKKQRLI